ncbi:MAG TPA: TlpA disulfide reductase family protein [Halalkalibaculum sp.]|nr:TlpA disulfide reductase family protein [Halalkalibaculum sp.]
MKLVKKVIITISLIWTALSLGLIAWNTLVDPPACAVDNGNTAEVIDKLPEFEFELMDNNTKVTKESIKGSYTLLYFWSTSCSICVKEMPYLHETYEAFQNQNFEIIAVSYNEKEETVRKFMDQQYSMPWKHTVIGDDREYAKETFKSFGFEGSPHKVLVSPEGEILEVMSGFSGESLHDKVQDHLNS